MKKKVLSLIMSLVMVFGFAGIMPEMEMKVEAAPSIEAALNWAISIANDNSHGYSQANRNGPDYDCSSLVVAALKNTGFTVGDASYTGNMKSELTKYGFTWISWSEISSYTNLKRGDILLNNTTAGHTEFYLGNKQNVGAHQNYGSPATGDQSGKEISVASYYWHPWDGVLRYTATPPTPVNRMPDGRLDAYSGGNGSVYVYGWGYDPDDTSASLRTDVYLYKPNDLNTAVWGTAITANAKRTDVNGVHGCGDYHGFEATLTTNVSAGDYVLKVALIDTAGGTAKWLEGGTVTIKTDSIQNLGDDFNAIIGHEGKVIMASHDGKIKINSKTANADMIAKKYTWHFMKNSDGSYGIWSYYGGKILETASGSSGSAIQLASSYTNAANQRWFIVKSGNSYLLRSACSENLALDLPNNNLADGTALALYTKNYTPAQLFSISNLANDTSKPTVSVSTSNKTNDTFKVVINANDNNGVKKVTVSATSWKGNDKKVYDAVQKNASTWECTVKSSDFKNEHGAFYFTACAYDYNGNVGVKSDDEKIGVYTVTFDANTGSVGTKSKEVVYGYPYNRKGDLPTPTKKGYTFTGWYTAKTGGTKINNTTKVTATSNHILYAQWKANSYTVTFNANEGSCSTPSKSVTYNGTYGTLPTPTRTGYTFTGWYTAKTGGTKITADTKVTITAAQTLYAQWKANTYTRTLDPMGGTCDKKSLTITWGQKAGTFPTPTKTGYTFTGWYTDKTGGTKCDPNATLGYAGDSTWYARWTPNTYKRTLELNGGKCDKTSITVTFGQKIGELPIPSKPGYKFLGWYNVNDDLVKSENVLNAAGSASDGVYHAQWKAKGDLNKDDEVNVRDAVIFQRYLTSKEALDNEALSETDLNDDGKINVFDVIIMKRVFVEKLN